jgi:hypothetical protein
MVTADVFDSNESLEFIRAAFIALEHTHRREGGHSGSKREGKSELHGYYIKVDKQCLPAAKRSTRSRDFVATEC